MGSVPTCQVILSKGYQEFEKRAKKNSGSRGRLRGQPAPLGPRTGRNCGGETRHQPGSRRLLSPATRPARSDRQKHQNLERLDCRQDQEVRQELIDKGLVLEAKRSRAGRKYFLEGAWKH